MKRTLIRGATIVTMDQQGDLYDADILIEGSRIKEIAKHINVQADNTINGSGYIVIPGLINAHMHTWQTALRGVATQRLQATSAQNNTVAAPYDRTSAASAVAAVGACVRYEPDG